MRTLVAIMLRPAMPLLPRRAAESDLTDGDSTEVEPTCRSRPASPGDPTTT